MRKHLIITLAIAGLAATTACGSKSSYLSAKLHEREKVKIKEIETPAPPAEASVEAQADQLLTEDKQFQKTRNSEDTASLQETVKAAELTLNFVGQNAADAQAEVKLFSASSEETCAPQLKKSNEFDRNDLAKGGFDIKELGRAKCVDTSCDNLLLIVEKKGFVSPVVEVKGAVAILMTRKEGTRVYQPVAPQSSAQIHTVEILEDTVQKCKEANQDVTKKEVADRIIAINVEIERLQKEITALETSAMNDGSKKSAIDALRTRIAALEAEKKSLETTNKGDEKAVNDNSGNVTRISEINARLLVIDDEITKLQNNQIAMGESAKTARIAELTTEKNRLTSEKNILIQHI